MHTLVFDVAYTPPKRPLSPVPAAFQTGSLCGRSDANMYAETQSLLLPALWPTAAGRCPLSRLKS